MTLSQYIETIARRYKAGNTTEHSFRGDLQQLIETLFAAAGSCIAVGWASTTDVSEFSMFFQLRILPK